jgi:hypothetical protein
LTTAEEKPKFEIAETDDNAIINDQTPSNSIPSFMTSDRYIKKYTRPTIITWIAEDTAFRAILFLELTGIKRKTYLVTSGRLRCISPNYAYINLPDCSLVA